LQDIEDRQVHKGTFCAIVHLSALYDDSVSRQIDTPSQGRCTA
jgi:hypothetical protein